ncbi:galactosyltransferase-related protein [Pantoea sp. LMR881]|uniref:galactosyltransferase-related protein n=1 Tax=Pantoea sp. LMR881 TaxID=3014336 RepID=UPI0022AF354F|nr:galactosyltransferase-related protein [Pantoea sp. LMR881]MCZ4060269.1 galactosyltransferase-related protein [Pantoea sp. LMR881]
MITAIIPIDLARRPFDIINKANLISQSAEKQNIKIIYGHNDRNTIFDRLFKQKISKSKASTIRTVKLKNTAINTAKMRNIAFDDIDTEYMLLLDVDIYPEFSLYFKYLNKMKNGDKPFYIFPCLYLTQYGTKKLARNKTNVDELSDLFFSFSRKEFLHLASPSSITLLKTKDYKKINGFNENYEGHGFEDFDFLLRLAKLHKINFEHSDLIVNRTARSPLFALGFRKYIGELCLDLLLEKDLTFHMFHTKDNNLNYYSNRNSNFEKFRLIHGKHLDQDAYSNPDLITSFLIQCSNRGIEVQDYSILFENKPGHIDRYDSLRKKIRFLFK